MLPDDLTRLSAYVHHPVYALVTPLASRPTPVSTYNDKVPSGGRCPSTVDFHVVPGRALPDDVESSGFALTLLVLCTAEQKKNTAVKHYSSRHLSRRGILPLTDSITEEQCLVTIPAVHGLPSSTPFTGNLDAEDTCSPEEIWVTLEGSPYQVRS